MSYRLALTMVTVRGSQFVSSCAQDSCNLRADEPSQGALQTTFLGSQVSSWAWEQRTCTDSITSQSPPSRPCNRYCDPTDIIMNSNQAG